MEIWGITGVIGSGKSTAVEILKKKGFPCVDADQVSRLVVDKNTEMGKEGFESVYRAFGNEVLDNLGDLDRGKLRAKMMRNPDDRQKLEEILHPLILAHIDTLISTWRSEGHKMCFVEGSRLVESGFHRKMTGLLVITADEAKIVSRVVKRDSMGKDEVKMMVSIQDQSGMLREAKFELPNNGAKKVLQSRLEKFIALRQQASS